MKITIHVKGFATNFYCLGVLKAILMLFPMLIVLCFTCTCSKEKILYKANCNSSHRTKQIKIGAEKCGEDI